MTSQKKAAEETRRRSTRSQALTRLVATKNRLVCGKLMSRQIVTRFDPDKKVCSSIGQCAVAFIHFFCLCSPGLTLKLSFNISKVASVLTNESKQERH